MEFHVQSGAKAILIGEHAVVYGHKAIATALNDITLSIKFNYSDSLIFEIYDKHNPELFINAEIYQTLKSCWTEIYLHFKNLNLIIPKTGFFHIYSNIPLGAGLGGSASISIAFCNLAEKLTNYILNISEKTLLTNKLDSIFHGNASGIDVSTILTGGLISYSKYETIKKINLAKEFYLVLVDSKERSTTANMIKQVENLIKKDNNKKRLLNQIGELSNISITHCENGDLPQLGLILNEAHLLLKEFYLSTSKIEEIRLNLLKLGALGAKLTGGGGGGLCLAIFTDKPNEEKLKQIFANNFFISHMKNTN